MRVSGALCWVGHYFGWVEVGGALFWVGGGGWGRVGVGALFDNVYIKWKTYFNTEHFFHIFPTLQLIMGVPPNTF